MKMSFEPPPKKKTPKFINFPSEFHLKSVTW